MFPSYFPSLEYRYLYYFGVLIAGISLLSIMVEWFYRKKVQFSYICLFVSGLYFFIYSLVYLFEFSGDYWKDYGGFGMFSCASFSLIENGYFYDRHPGNFGNAFNHLSIGLMLLESILLVFSTRWLKGGRKSLPYHYLGMAGFASLLITFTPIGVGVAKLRFMLCRFPDFEHHQSMYERWLERKPDEYHLAVTVIDFEPGGCRRGAPLCSYRVHVRDESLIKVLENSCPEDRNFSIEWIHRRAGDLIFYGDNGISRNRFKIPIVSYNEELGYIEYLDEDNYHNFTKCGAKIEGQVFYGYSVKIEPVSM